jgi:chromosome condensin MukBEF complex kleisin-like MukF subunit
MSKMLVNSSVSLIRSSWAQKGFRFWIAYTVQLYNVYKFIKTSINFELYFNAT